MWTPSRVLGLTASVLVLPACLDRVLVLETDGGGETADTDTTPTSSTETESDAATEDTGVPECIDIVFEGALPTTITGTTLGASDDFRPSCTNSLSGDIAILFTAPAAGQYRFDTQGSTYDTVLDVVQGACTGDSLGCNDDAAGATSSVTVDLSAGQEVTIVVDGFGEEGDWTLNLQRLGDSSCPDQNLGTSELPFAVGGSNAGMLDSLGGTCGGAGGGEQTFAWTPPYDGIFAIDALDAAFDDVLYVLAGTCAGTELACNDDVGASLGAGAVVSLPGGAPVTVVVDSVDTGSGPFTLVLQDAPNNCDWAFGQFFGTPFSMPGELPSGLNFAGTSCGGHFSDDYTIEWTPEFSGAYQIRVTADFEPVISVSQNCQERACVAGNVLDVDAIAGEPLVVAVDGATKALGGFQLTIDENQCPLFELPPDPFVFVDGSIVGAGDTVSPGCVEGDGPDHTYGWTPPVSAAYLVSLAGSNFDTVLAVFDGSCNGAQLACDDDGTGDLQSELVVELSAGQAVVIAVDGFGGDVGDYQLSIQPL